MDGQVTAVQETGQAGQEAAQAASVVEAAVQETQTSETTQEKVGALQKFIDGLFGGRKAADGKNADEAAEGEEPLGDGGDTASGKTFTQTELDAAIEAAKKQWQDEAAEAERVRKLSPEEKAAEEQKKSTERIAELEGQLMRKELREAAVAALEKDGFPVALAGILDYSSMESMEKSLKTTTEVFKESIASTIKTRLRGKTPEGLGAAASSENLLRDQIAKNIRGL